MDAYVVIGNPIEHSRSPAIHQKFAQITGHSLSYERCLSPLDDFALTIAQLQQRQVRGCNVTVPFKLEAAQLAHRSNARVQLAEAANTLVLHADGTIEAFNTDGVGLVRDIQINANTTIAGQDVLILGAGGAAAGALAPLMEQQPRSITVANRSVQKAVDLVARHTAMAESLGVTLQATALNSLDMQRRAGTIPVMHILINATASSMQGASLPIEKPSALLTSNALVYDMMYGPAAAPFLEWTKQHCPQATTRDGLGMLVEQAAESFSIWREVRPDSAPVLRDLRSAIG